MGLAAGAGERERVEAGPREERAAPAVGPDLGANGRAARQAAGVEAVGVGDDQRVGGNGEANRLRQPERGELFGRNPQRAALRQAVATGGDGLALALLPLQPFRSQACASPARRSAAPHPRRRRSGTAVP